MKRARVRITDKSADELIAGGAHKPAIKGVMKRFMPLR